MQNYFAYLKSKYSPNTANAYWRDVRDFMILNGNPDKITKGHLRKFLRHLLSQKFSEITIRRKLQAVQNYLSYQKKTGQIQNLPKIHSPKIPSRLPKIISTEKLVAASKEDIYIDVLYSTGIRESELRAIRRRDIDLEALTILVHGKGQKERLVVFGPNLKKHLYNYFCENDISVDARTFPITKSALYRKVRRLFGKGYSPHSIRHSFATHLYNGGANLEAIRMLLGHESLSTTQIYTSVATKKIGEEYKKAFPRS